MSGATSASSKDEIGGDCGAVAEARQRLAEGGIPIGAALFDGDGRLLGSGHNRMGKSAIQQKLVAYLGDPSGADLSC